MAGLFLQLLAPGDGQTVVPGLAVVLRGAPEGCDPAAILQPVQGGVQRPLVDAQCVPGDLLDALGNGPSVPGAGLERAQNQEIERPLKQIEFGWVAHNVGRLQQK